MKNKTKLIQEIARQTGVSVATAYRAVNAPLTVAEQTRKRVLKILQEKNVSISRRPRSDRLRGAAQRPTRVAFLVPQLPYPTVEVISDEMMQGIQQAFASHGTQIFYRHYTWGEEQGLSLLTNAVEGEPLDGILLRPPSNRLLVAEFCRGRKVVLLGNGFPELDIPTVISDDQAGIFLLLDYLWELGHRRIAFVSLAPHMMIYRRRLDAYVAALFAKGLAPDPRLVKCDTAWVIAAEKHKAVCDRLLHELLELEDPPTAVICGSDSYAAGLAAAARERGLRVPEDLSLTGYGNQYFAGLADPPITTVHVDQRLIGEVGALQLLQLIAGCTCPNVSLIRPKFVERRSCAERAA